MVRMLWWNIPSLIEPLIFIKKKKTILRKELATQEISDEITEHEMNN
jgi:hypothetical protein